MGREDQAQGVRKALDDQGTGQNEARTLLKLLCERGFDGRESQMAVALGRPVEEVERWLNSDGPVDDDIVIKARGIATERNIPIE